MNNKFTVSGAFFVVAFFIVIYSSFNSYTEYKQMKKKTHLDQFDFKVLQNYMRPRELNSSYRYIWGLKEEKVQVHSDENKSVMLTPPMKIRQEGNKICLQKKCVKFLGLYRKNNKMFAVLSSKIFKKQIKSFAEQEELMQNLYIEKIDAGSVALKYFNQQYKFNLFDINASKYKPKDSNETNL